MRGWLSSAVVMVFWACASTSQPSGTATEARAQGSVNFAFV